MTYQPNGVTDMRNVLLVALIAALGIVIVHQAARTVIRPLRANPRHEFLETL